MYRPDRCTRVRSHRRRSEYESSVRTQHAEQHQAAIAAVTRGPSLQTYLQTFIVSRSVGIAHRCATQIRPPVRPPRIRIEAPHHLLHR